ncbi:hypothetical protein GBAR_LOCUS4989 [Geodia barretti]|uniref:Uncharacterized protein n=1 Tax=Geodia barretti TaxID=519541 RepID=A0AA35R8U1_GEOBA|nr:hypothetical protein GBAR_LOCUS4989 [Geodia barretti]
MALVVNLTTIPESTLNRDFSIEITCGINLTAVGLANPPAELSRLYELPRSSSVTISVKL